MISAWLTGRPFMVKSNIPLSLPSLSTSTTGRAHLSVPNAANASSIPRQNGVGASGAIIFGSAARSRLTSRVNTGLISTSRPKVPTRATSSGRSRANSCSEALRSRGRLPSMLPDTSSITMRRMGWGVLSNSVSVCGCPSSRTSKSFCSRDGTSRPSPSVTVAKTRTVSLAPRNTGCWADTAAKPRTATATAPNIRIRIRISRW